MKRNPLSQNWFFRAGGGAKLFAAVVACVAFLGTGVSWGQTVLSSNSAPSVADNGGNGAHGLNGDATGGGGGGGGGGGSGGAGGGIETAGGNG